MARLISLLILVIDVIVIIDIVKSNKDNEKKILWIIAVVLLPYSDRCCITLLAKGSC